VSPESSAFDSIVAFVLPEETALLFYSIGTVILGFLAMMTSIAIVENDRRVFGHFTTCKRCAIVWLFTIAAIWIVSPYIVFPTLRAVIILFIHFTIIRFTFKTNFATGLLWGSVEWAVLVIGYLTIGIMWIVLKPWVRLLSSMAEKMVQ
jgi:hypothetical protein